MRSVIGKWRIVLFKAGRCKGGIVEEGLEHRIGVLQRGDRKGIKMVTFIKVIKNELVVVIGGQLEIDAGGAFDGDGGVGEADGDVIPLFGPGEMGDEVECFLVSTWLGVSKFARFSVF